MRSLVLALFLTVALAGCLAPRPETVARNWRPDGPAGLTLGQLLAVSPGLVVATWEAFEASDGKPMVRLALEYGPAAAARNCPPAGAGTRLAARAFAIVKLAVAPDGTVDFVSAEGQAYTPGGQYAAYPLDIGVIADLVARACPLPCPALLVPDYL